MWKVHGIADVISNGNFRKVMTRKQMFLLILIQCSRKQTTSALFGAVSITDVHTINALILLTTWHIKYILWMRPKLVIMMKIQEMPPRLHNVVTFFTAMTISFFPRMCYAATVPFTDLVNVRDPQKVVHAYDFGPILSYDKWWNGVVPVSARKVTPVNERQVPLERCKKVTSRHASIPGPHFRVMAIADWLLSLEGIISANWDSIVLVCATRERKFVTNRAETSYRV